MGLELGLQPRGSELGLKASSKIQVAINPVTIWWACWACVWTAFVVAGMSFLIYHRRSPILRVRGLGLSLSAITLLHLYWFICQFGLMIGAMMPGDTQYWVMGLYLPCGIALFHASNARFLHVAKLQKKYTSEGKHLIEESAQIKHGKGLINRFRRLDFNSKTFITVGAGMFIQIFLTVLMWVISRKWHSSWGIPGTAVHGTPMQQMVQMGRGWEWWPGVFWQFFWSWIVAPYVLWKSRNINDTHGWRTQTIGCAIANLHATPMWLIALYVPAMAPLQAYWIPPQWICVSIMFTEIFTIFVPCWEVMRCQSLRKETLDAIAQWESKKGHGSEAKSLNSVSTMVDSMMSGWKSTNGSINSNNSDASILTMTALEYVLDRNPTPLQRFSALHDFSGENIAFLTSITKWKNSAPKALRENPVNRDGNNKDLIRESFNLALHVYAEFISTRHAEFPVNISSQMLKKLDSIFERPACILYGEEREADPATPFDFAEPPSPAYSESSEKPLSSVTAVKDLVQYWGDIPEEFDVTVFDDAEDSIKYLVLTNTWPKFVRRSKSSASSFDTLRSGMEVV